MNKQIFDERAMVAIRERAKHPFPSREEYLANIEELAKKSAARVARGNINAQRGRVLTAKDLQKRQDNLADAILKTLGTKCL